MRPHYSTDLTDPEWARLAPVIPEPKTGGRPARDRREIIDAISYVIRTQRLAVQIVERPPRRTDGPPCPRFQAAPRRWVVERTFAWLGRYRRMSRDYEYLGETTRANIHICMIRLMLRRLAYP